MYDSNYNYKHCPEAVILGFISQSCWQHQKRRELHNYQMKAVNTAKPVIVRFYFFILNVLHSLVLDVI